MAERNFGNQLIGAASVQAPPANNKAVCRFQNDSGIDLLVNAIWFDWGAAQSSGFLAKGVIYSDVAGAPSALLATSNEFSSNAVFSKTTAKFEFDPPVLVPSGGYVWAGLIANQMGVSSRCLSSGSIYYNSNSYASGPSSTFGGSTVALYTYPMFLVGDDGTATFGRRSIDTSAIASGDGNYQPNREHAERVRLGGAAPALVTSISTYIRNTEAAAKCKAAIYTASSGSFFPGTLIAQSSEVIGSTANTWMELPIPGGVVLSPGDYWLTFITDINLTTPVVRMSGDLCVDGTITQASAWPSSYGTSGTSLRQLQDDDTRGIDIYASYTLVPAGGGQGNFLMFC